MNNLPIKYVRLLLEKDYHSYQLKAIESEKRKKVEEDNGNENSAKYWSEDISKDLAIVHYIENLLKEIFEIEKESTPSK